MEGWRVHRGDAMECIGTCFQEIPTAADRLHGLAFEWLDHCDVIGADKLSDSVVMLADKTRFFVSTHGENSIATAGHDRNASRTIVFGDPPLSLSLAEPLLSERPLDPLGG